MRIIIRILAFVALCISYAWLYFERSFEPALTTVVSLSKLISTFFFEGKTEEKKDRAGITLLDLTANTMATEVHPPLGVAAGCNGLIVDS